MNTGIKEINKIEEKDQRAKLVEKELNRLFPKRSIKKVLFVAPPDADQSMFHYPTAHRGRYWNFPPYGVGTIAAHLRQLGVTVDIINLNNEILKKCQQSQSEESFDFQKEWTTLLLERINAFAPDFIGVTCMFTQTNQATMDVCHTIKQHYPHIPQALGGVHITNCFMNDKAAVNLLEDFAEVDLLFMYEAELAMKQFVKAVNKETNSDDLYQVYFNTSKDKLYFADRLTPQSEDLNVVPAHDLMTPTELGSHGKIGSFYCHKPEGSRFTTILSNRGCRAQCTFCSVRNFNGMSVRRRSAQSVVEELTMLHHDYGINHVMWLDDDFLKDKEKTLELFDEMIKAKLDMTWDCTNGVIAASCTEDVIAKAVESGCIGLIIGMESGNSEILKKIKKPGTVNTFLTAAKVFRKFEQINVRVFLMIGFPNETYRQILDTINVASKMDLDWYNITILQPLPNTPIFNSMVEQGLINDVNFNEIRYNSGPYGKQRKKAENKIDLLRPSFKEAFSTVDLDSVPPAEQLDDIWAYMNFHLNFKRLFKETRPVKLAQNLRYVQNITDLVAPESAFAMYFCGYLQKKVHGYIDQGLIKKLEERIATTPYWANRFKDFGLSVDHLKEEKFPTP